MARRVALVDPVVARDEVVVNGRYVFAAGFLRALLESGRLDEVVVFGDPGADRAAAERAGLGAFLDGSSRGGPGRGLRIEPLEAAPRLLASEPYLALHSGMNKALLAALAPVRALAGTSTPLTCTVHSLSYPTQLPGLLGTLLADVRTQDAIICPSASAKTSLRAVLAALDEGLPAPARGAIAPVRLDVVPHGIDTERFRPRQKAPARAKLGLPEDRPILLWVGRLSAWNKIDFLPMLRALAPLWRDPARAERPPILWLVATERSAYADRLMVHGRDLGLDVRLAIDPPEADLPLWYAAADLFLGLSDSFCEMFGLVVLEAMACGAAIVASEVGGYRDLLEHERTGLLVPTWGGDCLDLVGALGLLREDAASLARANATLAIDGEALLRACRRLLDHPDECAALGRAARARVEALYAWPGVIARYVGLWEELAAAAGPPPPRAPAGLTFPWSRAYGELLTHRLAEDTPFVRAAGAAAALEDLWVFVHPLVAAGIEKPLVAWIVAGEGAFTLGDLRRDPRCPAGAGAGVLERALLWALKQGLVRPVAGTLAT